MGSIQVNISPNKSSVEIIRADGRKTFFRKEEIDNVNVSAQENFNFSGTLVGNPFKYIVYIKLSSGREESFDIQDVSNQATWTHDLPGLNIAASDIAQSVGLDSNIDATLTQILAAIQSQSEYEAKLIVDNNDVTWLEVRIYNQGTGTFDPPIYYPSGSNTPGTPAAPITYINPNTYLAQIVANTTPDVAVFNGFDVLSTLTGTYGAGKKSFTLVVISGVVIVDGDTISEPITLSWGLGDKSTMAGVSYDATNGVLYGITLG